MKTKDQIFIVHGGTTFKNKKDYLCFLKERTVSTEKRMSWSGDYLDKKLGKKYHIIRPRMPLQDNAQYEEWKIHFEKFIPLLRNNLILIGSSLGGIFLAKYLSEQAFPKKIRAVFLVCPPYDNTVRGEELVGGFVLKSNLLLLEENAQKLFLLFSKDDPVVPVIHADKYRKKLPTAEIIIYKSKNGHFQITEFPEIVKMIQSLK